MRGWRWGWEVTSVTLWAWRVPGPRMDRTMRWECGQWHETHGTRDVACPSTGQRDRGLGTGQRDTRPGITECCWGPLDTPHPQPVGGRVGPGDTGWSSPGTCVSGGRQRIVPRPARCSSPCLERDRPQPTRNLSHCQPPWFQSAREKGTSATRRWGQGHSLFSLLRTLLAIFLISVVSCSRSSLVSAGSRV